MIKSKHVLYVLALLAAFSCKTVTHLQEGAVELFRGEVVAKVGDHRLHRSELESYIPAGVSAEDSAALARQYILTWAEDLLLMDMAESQLSSQEKNVNAELEEYRKSLIKYRYEQLYIQQRLDTLVTDEEIAGYYQANQDRFRLERPILKSRYLIIPADARSLKLLKAKMSSDDEMEVMETDSLAASVAIKYVDASEVWMDALVVAREAGVDYRALQAGFKAPGFNKEPFVEVPDESGNLHVIYVVEQVADGKIAPQEYCEERIRDLILSARKHSLETGLTESLLEDARKNNKFVIYENEK
ncbi:MAG: hypothetical protein IJQ96_09960 [Bacteroidales bacterium]|nr:hypothetical protein [Bacteroidales bacterium]